jgi:hypothetical protein
MHKKRIFWSDYFKVVVKKWWWLMGSGIGTVLTILALVGKTPHFLWWMWLIIACTCLLVALILGLHDIYVSLELNLEKPNSTQLRRRKIGYRESTIIANLNEQMGIIHGHDDIVGIEQDAIEGMAWDKILEQKCSHCQKPRNEKGKDYY